MALWRIILLPIKQVPRNHLPEKWEPWESLSLSFDRGDWTSFFTCLLLRETHATALDLD